MARRAEVNCRICHSFSHSTKQCKKIVLGFKKKDALPLYHYESVSKILDKIKHYEIDEDKLVPVVSVEEAENIVNRAFDFLDNSEIPNLDNKDKIDCYFLGMDKQALETKKRLRAIHKEVKRE